MAVLQHPHAHVDDRWARWAWTALALVPVGLFLGVFFALLAGDGEDFGSVSVGLVGALLFVAPATVAIMLAVEASRTGYPHGRTLVGVAAAILVVTLVLLPMLAFSGVGWLLGMAAVVVALVAFRWRTHGRTSA